MPPWHLLKRNLWTPLLKRGLFFIKTKVRIGAPTMGTPTTFVNVPHSGTYTKSVRTAPCRPCLMMLRLTWYSTRLKSGLKLELMLLVLRVCVTKHTVILIVSVTKHTVTQRVHTVTQRVTQSVSKHTVTLTVPQMMMMIILSLCVRVTQMMNILSPCQPRMKRAPALMICVYHCGRASTSLNRVHTWPARM